MTNPFEGRDLEPQVQAAMREIERERWKSTRSPWQRRGLVGSQTVSTTAFRVKLIETDTGDLERVKRLQIKLMVPKGGAAGWFGTVRIAAGETPAVFQPAFGLPRVLRPIQFLANPDHATYWDYYLAAVNLADGGDLYFVGQTEQGGSASCTYTARWISERGIEG